MPIITLTTDLGTKDFFLGALKGAIYSQIPSTTVVDITHQIEPFNLIQASYIIRNAYHHYPNETIHIIGISVDMNKHIRHLALMVDGHYFIGTDNGIFSLLFDKKPDKIVELNINQDTDSLNFPAKDIFVKAACHLARGGTLEVIGKEVTGFKEVAMLRPVVQDAVIKGSVIYIDSYGNAITNITRSFIKEAGKGKEYKVNYSRSEYIKHISEAYHAVVPGETLCIFGLSGNMEVAINQGNASRLLGLKVGDIIRIEFYDNQNS